MPKKKEKLIFEDSDFRKLLDIYEGGNSIALTIIKCGLDYRLLEFTKSQAKEFIDLIISDGIVASSPITNPNGIGYISINIDCNMLSDIISYAIKEEDIDDIVRYTVDTIITAVDGVDNIDSVEWAKLLRNSWWKNSKRAKKLEMLL